MVTSRSLWRRGNGGKQFPTHASIGLGSWDIARPTASRQHLMETLLPSATMSPRRDRICAAAPLVRHHVQGTTAFHCGCGLAALLLFAGQSASQTTVSGGVAGGNGTDGTNMTAPDSDNSTLLSFTPSLIDTDETASFLYAGAGVGGLMVFVLLLIIVRSFYTFRGSYDLKRERELAERANKPASPGNPTHFSSMPLSVYNETSTDAANGHHSNSHRYESNGRNWADGGGVVTVVNAAAQEYDGATPASTANTVTGQKPMNVRRPSRHPPQAPVPATPQKQQQRQQSNNSSSTDVAPPTWDTNATVSSISPLIGSPDSAVPGLRPTPKVRMSIRQKNSETASPIATSVPDEASANRPEPLPRSARNSGTNQLAGSSPSLANSDDVTRSTAQLVPDAQPQNIDRQKVFEACPREDTLGGSGAAASPRSATGGLLRSRSSKRGSTRTPMPPPARPPSVPPPTPPAPATPAPATPAPATPGLPTRPNRPAPTVPDEDPETGGIPPPPPLPPKPRQPVPVPYMHFDITNMPSNASEMSWAADHHPDSFVIDL